VLGLIAEKAAKRDLFRRRLPFAVASQAGEGGAAHLIIQRLREISALPLLRVGMNTVYV
jgi:hypothetical protein